MNVVIAILLQDERVLITRRSLDKSHPGYWEFPGGKVELDETTEEAVRREVKEEIGVSIVSLQPFMQVSHQYTDKAVHLNAYLISSFTGQPQYLDFQMDMRWVTVQELQYYQFPEANKVIKEKLQNDFKQLPAS